MPRVPKNFERAAAARDSDAPHVARRIRTEGRICAHLVERLLAAGYRLSVDDGEETTVVRSRDRGAILEGLFTTDSDRILVYTPGAARHAGWVSLVYGNDGHDVISDYTTSLTEELKATCAYAERLAQGR